MYQNNGIPQRSRKKEPQGKSETGLKRARDGKEERRMGSERPVAEEGGEVGCRARSSGPQEVLQKNPQRTSLEGWQQLVRWFLREKLLREVRGAAHLAIEAGRSRE